MTSVGNHQVGHFEIPVDNVENLKNIYSSLFGWQFERGETQGYYVIKNAGISGALTQKENPQQLSTQFVTVESIRRLYQQNKTVWSEGCKRQTGNIRGLLCGIRRPSEKYIRTMAGKIK
jgi:predicted enzyme related to lactoylglutathione lyase